MKVRFAGFITILLVLGFVLSGCSQAVDKIEDEPKEDTESLIEENLSEEVETISFKSGTYSGSGQGRGGEIVVDVTFSEREITDVVVQSHSETAGMSDPAIEQIPIQIKENQSMAVDTVSGATVTSNGIIEAVGKAAEQAGVDPKLLMREIQRELKTEEDSADVVIIGAGAAGMSAALSATKDKNIDVLVIEKGATNAVSNGAQGGGPSAAETTVQAKENATVSVETLYKFMLESSNYTVNGSLLRNVVEASTRSMANAEETGIPIILQEDSYNIGFRARHIFPMFGSARMDFFQNAAEANGARFLYSTEGKEIVTDDNGKVVGLIAEKSDGTILNIATKSVIVCTGGYLGNQEMIKEHFGDIGLMPVGNTLSTGDGINMVVNAGGMLERNGWGVVFNEFASSNSEDPWWFGGNPNHGFGLYGNLLVNTKGNRFANEGNIAKQPLSIGGEILSQQGTYYCIIDDEYYQACQTVGIREYLGNPSKEEWTWDVGDIGEAGVKSFLGDWADFSTLRQLVLEGANEQLDEAIEQGWAYKADTIEELAEYFQLENLPETVANYNEMCHEGKDSQFYKDELFLTAVDEGPYYAFKYQPTAWCTLGGVKVDENLNALTAELEAIENLYVAGLDAGSLFSSPYYENEGVGFGMSMASGTLAGENVIKYINQNK